VKELEPVKWYIPDTPEARRFLANVRWRKKGDPISPAELLGATDTVLEMMDDEWGKK
jgi:hypothetical protein